MLGCAGGIGGQPPYGGAPRGPHVFHPALAGSRDRQEQLKAADELGVMALLQEIMQLSDAKKKLAKKTGRVVVG